ncbi:MAG TPA: rhodanese-like domain-containing protein [Candidatus Limnocylindria bacterium]|nr:rhodanese-like domain-containing protein [Candidatus Limnocylindria bacterium]
MFLPLAVVLAVATQTGPAPDSSAWPRSMVVSAEWLESHRGDRGLVILHVGERSSYEREHIPGARYISFDDVARRKGNDTENTLEMLAPDDLRASLERFGISDDSRIVVYYADEWVSPATRVVFTLDWFGLGDRTALLDGGIDAWKRRGLALTSDVPPAVKGKLSSRSPRPIIVDAAWVRANAPGRGFALVDARAPVYYDGPRHGEHRPGHIPGAVNIPFTSLADDSLRLTSLSALRDLFRAAGVKEGDTVVAYCHIGQQATAVLFAARALGHPVRLYDGSFDDWSRRTELPVESSRKSGQ